MRRVVPLFDRIVVIPDKAEEKTKGGIIIPGAAKKKPLSGKVVEVGEGTKEIPMALKVGDMVLYGQNIGNTITLNEQEFIIMRQSDVLAKIE
jgi:chaperonin GroES